MKKIVLLIIANIIIFSASAVIAQKTMTVTVTVNNILVDKAGVVKIGLYNAEKFPTIGEELFGIDLEVKKDTITYVFKDIPAGTYGIASFQDIDVNNELNTNFLGFPVEPYGFSNNKYGLFGPPAFGDISFEVVEGESVELIINLE